MSSFGIYIKNKKWRGLDLLVIAVVVGALIGVCWPVNTRYVEAATYIGSINSNKFHNTDCIWGKRILESNLVTYNSRAEAVDGNRVPCKVCKP